MPFRVLLPKGESLSRFQDPTTTREVRDEVPPSLFAARGLMPKGKPEHKDEGKGSSYNSLKP